MDARELPARPTLDRYQKQAKDLVKSRKSSDPEVLRRIRKHHPRIRNLSESEFLSSRFALADAQWVIAREHGFESWPKFTKRVEALARKNSSVSKFESAVDAVITGDIATLERLVRENPDEGRLHVGV